MFKNNEKLNKFIRGTQKTSKVLLECGRYKYTSPRI